MNLNSSLVLADIYLEMAPFLVTRLSDSSYLVFNSNGEGVKSTREEMDSPLGL
ncbi:MAG: hypothetical protein ACP5T2_03760 [Thermoprotei archaeon]